MWQSCLVTRQEKTIVNTSFLPTSAGTQEVSAELRDTAEQETARARERWGRGRGGSVSVCVCVWEWQIRFREYSWDCFVDEHAFPLKLVAWCNWSLKVNTAAYSNIRASSQITYVLQVKLVAMIVFAISVLQKMFKYYWHQSSNY